MLPSWLNSCVPQESNLEDPVSGNDSGADVPLEITLLSTVKADGFPERRVVGYTGPLKRYAMYIKNLLPQKDYQKTYRQP